MPAITAPPVITIPWAASGLKNAIPNTSQIGITPGAASWPDGFPPLTMTDESGGGVPPDGKDMNGGLYTVSAYAAWLQAGGYFVYSAAVASAGGYPQYAILRSASDPTKFWYNTTANNIVDPDGAGTGWTAFFPITGSAGTAVVTATLGAGSTNNQAINLDTGFLDITANAAGSDLTGLSGGADGQVITISQMTANTLTLKSLTGSSAGNQFRLPFDLTLVQYGSQSFKKSSTLGVWVPV
jgi:hypothetical protein